MRILFLDQFSDCGGAQLCLLDLLPAIAERGWEAHVAAPGDGPLLERSAGMAAVKSVEKLRLGLYHAGAKGFSDYARFAWDLPSAGSQIESLIRHHRIDLVQVNGPRVLPAAAWGHGEVPVLFHCHSYLARSSEAALVRWCLRRMRARAIANCRWVRRPLGDVAEVSVIYNGVADHARPRIAGDTAPLTVGVIGRISPEKGQAEFMRAARIVHRTGIACRFVVCGAPRFGDAASERYYEEVRVLGEGLPVEFTGWRDDIGDVLSSLDVLVVPSSMQEATTRVIPEAFSAAVPVIATRAGGIAEIVEHGQNGILFDSTDPDTLALVLAGALRKPRGELRAMGIRGRKAWQDRFRLDAWRLAVTNMMDGALRGDSTIRRRG